MKKLITPLLAILMIVTFTACRKEVVGPPGPSGSSGTQGPPGPALTGTIKGFIHVFDQYGNRMLTNLDSVTVSIDGTTRTTSTDVNGYYEFTDVTTGSYTLNYSKTGLGSNKVTNLQLSGGGDLYQEVRLSKIPSFDLVTFRAANSATDDTCRGSLPADTRSRSVIVFVGKTSDVSSDPATYLNSYTRTVQGGFTTFSVTTSATDLYNLGFTSGSTIYYAAYSISAGFTNNSSYTDIATGKMVYTGIGLNPMFANTIVP